jgi:hypothetical protein
MNTQDSQKADATTDEFGTNLRELVDRMIREGINLPKAGFRGNRGRTIAGRLSTC